MFALPLVAILLGLIPVQEGAVARRLVPAGPDDWPGRFGAAVWGARVNGRELLAVGAPDSASKSDQTRGEVILFDERRVAWRVLGARAGDRLGSSLAVFARTEGDESQVLAVSAPQGLAAPERKESGPGRVELRSLSDGELLLEASGEGVGDCFGSSLCALQDVDADGYAELAVGATQEMAVAPVGGKIPGYVALVSSKQGGILWATKGMGGDRCYGAALARIGDVDDDGLEDLLVGVPGPTGVPDAAGRIVALSAASGRQLYVVACDGELAGLGLSLAAVGDLDGDGCADAVAAGRPFQKTQSGLDVVRISGATGRTFGVTTLETGEITSPSGYSLAATRDAEGQAIIAVGLPFEYAPHFGWQAGVVEVVRPSGERLARFVPTKNECESMDHSLCSTPYLGSSLAFIEGLDGQAPCCVVGAPAFFRWGFVVFVDGLDWDGRQLIQEPEKLKVPLTLVR
jgi:FG-GAP repeat